jgi:hypothetical protein
MAKKRVHEIAKAHGLTCKELLAALKKAGVDAKAAQSSVEESDALAALKASGDGAGGVTATKTKPKQAPQKKAEAPKKAAAGTIRADFAQSIDANAVHGSDGPETASVEIAYFFPAMSIYRR